MQLVNIEKLTDILLLASFSVKLCYVFVFDDMLSEPLNLFKDDTLLNATKFVQLYFLQNDVCKILYNITKLLNYVLYRDESRQDLTTGSMNEHNVR